MKRTSTWLAVLALLVGCTDDDFPIYNELEGVRVLGVRAQPPDVRPGDETTVDALIYSEDEQARVARRWTLCPWPSGANDGFECLVNEASWKTAWKAAGLSGTALPLDLGSEGTATISFPDENAELRALCRELIERVGAAGAAPPNCDQEWRWTVRLRIESGGTEVDTIKDVRLVLDDDPSNQNPLPTKLSVVTDDGAQALDGISLDKDEDHELRLSIAEAEAESYERRPVTGETKAKPVRESLAFTWFVEGGETEHIRSVFGEDMESLRKATRNDWRTPDKARTSRVFVVVRDGRGGIGWQSGTAVIDD